MRELDGTDLKKVIKSGKPVAVFFYMETCPHCIPMHEPWGELEKEIPHMEFCKIESSKVPSEMGITGFPHFEVYKDSKKTKSVDGQRSKKDLKKDLFGGSGGRRRTKRHRTRRLVRRGRKATR
jgi:thiol-disulfide isomerase/thioredoxin